MKRALLVAGGTVAGVAAVLSYTPPELTAAASSGGLAPTNTSPNQSATTDQGSASAGTTSSPTQAPSNSNTQSPTQAPTKSSTKAATPAQKPAQTSTPAQSEATAPAQTSTQTPTQTPTQAPAPTATKKSTSGTKTVTGKAYNAGGFGNVQVKITLTDGVVTAAEALQYPNQDRRSSWISQQAIPWLVEQTLAAKNSANLDGVGGATFTTYAWISSLKSALQQAGI